MPTDASLRGRGHLRVGVEIAPRSVRVVSVWAVDGPVVQRARLIKPLVSLVEISGAPIFAEAVDDPRVVRGIQRTGAGHSQIVEKQGVLHVSVPFTDAAQLSNVRVRLFDTSRTSLKSADAPDVIHLVTQQPSSVRYLGEITTDHLASHEDWAKVGQELGVAVRTGRFEIFMDKKGLYRWRLRRASGEIVATSHQAFANRGACESDLQWIRANGIAASIVSLDLN